MSIQKYSILKNEIYGRYLAAAKVIKSGEVILSEVPTVIGPPISGSLICFKCCKNIQSCFQLCGDCKTAIVCKIGCSDISPISLLLELLDGYLPCTDETQYVETGLQVISFRIANSNGNLHSTPECKILKLKSINPKMLLENPQIIFPLRCLLLKTINPEMWTRLMELESHLDRRRDTPIWKRHALAVENILKNNNLLTESDVKDELIQKICGILDVNSFEVRFSQTNIVINPELQCLRGIYNKAAMMAHDCRGNTFLSVDDDFVLTVKASIDIYKNEPIFFNYASALQGTLERKQHLREGKYFNCSCTRCNDPTELNTNISSIKCHKCQYGYVTVIKPQDPSSEWECSDCNKKFKNFLINLIVDEGRRIIQEKSNAGITILETLYEKLLNTFHPNHYVLIEFQQILIGTYSSVPPNTSNLSKKILVCDKLLKVFEVIEPGISRARAMTLYQKQSGMIDLAHKNYELREISLETLLLKLKEAEKVLVESIKYLMHEPPKSPEGRLAHMALKELKMLRSSVNNIHEDLLNTSSKKQYKDNTIKQINPNIKKTKQRNQRK